MSRVGLKCVILFVVTVVWTSEASAYVPELVEQASLSDITLINDPELSQAFFGELTGFPHTYEIRAENPFFLKVTIKTPDLPANTNTLSGIIIKTPRRGRVEEITRLLAGDAEWEVERDTLTGDDHRIGSTFERELGPGVYRIEVHTPDNAEKYALFIGTRDEMTLGYIELLKRIARVKTFDGASPYFIIESPYVYVPLLVLIIVAGGAWYARRRLEPISH